MAKNHFDPEVCYEVIGEYLYNCIRQIRNYIKSIEVGGDGVRDKKNTYILCGNKYNM